MDQFGVKLLSERCIVYQDVIVNTMFYGIARKNARIEKMHDGEAYEQVHILDMYGGLAWGNGIGGCENNVVVVERLHSSCGVRLIEKPYVQKKIPKKK